MTLTQESTYFMHSPQESERLSAKVDADAYINKYLSKKIAQVSTFLDIGCGSGVIACKLAALYSDIQVTGVDLHPERFATEYNASKRPNLNLIQNNIYSLSLENSSYDFTHSRFLFEYLKSPDLALKEMIRVSKPGGTVLIQELDGQLVSNYPVEPSFSLTCEKVLGHLKETGFDPFIGRKLYNMFYTNDLKDIDVQLEPYHLFAGKIDSYNRHLWDMKLNIALPEISKALGSEEQGQKFKQEYMDYLDRPDTFSFSNVITITGKK